MFNSRDEALELVENGVVTAESMLTMCLKYMSTDDVADMLDCNELSERFMDDDEDDYEDDGQPTWEQEWADFGETYE
jgi:plasmid replication initiation protein